MDVTPRYLGGDSFLGRRDPRVLLLVPLLYLVAVAGVGDLRGVAFCALFAFVYYRAAGIPWREVRKNWIFVLGFTAILVVVNSILTDALTVTARSPELFTVPLTGSVVSMATLSYSLTIFIRYVTLAMVGFPVAFAVAPNDMGVAFARLGVPQRLAYAVDLTFRFIPSVAASVRETIDAQRIRGFEHKRKGNPLVRLKSLKPVVIPVTVNALVEAEDTANAMDLRGFGGGRRTWLRELSFGPADYLVVAGFLLLAAGMTAAEVLGFSEEVWIP
ncbi:energy-coupling factor transporter transmembrane component T family protein [Rhizohabitans arisaemae]|uniref:energy-coupling factor transporter transmembrane component T family protein n=1 Tax=Rhizohabitans arisaemae TaxID=2720610 RepID=UPI0024B1911B|nr:energy-coupling factor transporter transmembrane component T [Rhizohabitans arisaemae]